MLLGLVAQKHDSALPVQQQRFLCSTNVLAVLIFACVAGARWHTGYDHDLYLNYLFSQAQLGFSPRESFEPGFALITKAFAYSGVHFFFYFAFWAALQIGLLYYALRKHKFLLPWLALCLMLGPYFLHWMNSIRQVVIECLFVATWQWVADKKFWRFLLITLLAMTIHKVAIVMLPLYFVVQIKVKGNERIIAYTLLAMCIVAGCFPQWAKWLLQASGDLLGQFGYHYHALSDRTLQGFRTLTWGPNRLAALALVAIIIWLYPQVKQHFKGDRLLVISFRLGLIYACYNHLMANTTVFLLRPGEVMMGFMLVMTAYTLCYLYKSRRWLWLAALLVLACSFVPIELYKVAKMPSLSSLPVLYQPFFVN